MQDVIHNLEEISLQGWPAAVNEHVDGWWLRANGGYTRRANSVQALDAGTQSLEEKIIAAENWYAARNQPPIFRLTPASQPQNLDVVLEDRGYSRSGDTLVQTTKLDGLALAEDADFVCQPALDARWLHDWSSWNDVPSRTADAAAAMLGGLQNACFGRVGDGAVGLSVLFRGHLGLFNIVSAPDRRGQGYGTRLVAGLLRLGRSRGAHTAYLQVVAQNTSAQALYQKFGFRTRYPYWYRQHT